MMILNNNRTFKVCNERSFLLACACISCVLPLPLWFAMNKYTGFRFLESVKYFFPKKPLESNSKRYRLRFLCFIY